MFEILSDKIRLTWEDNNSQGTIPTEIKPVKGSGVFHDNILPNGCKSCRGTITTGTPQNCQISHKHTTTFVTNKFLPEKPYVRLFFSLFWSSWYFFSSFSLEAATRLSFAAWANVEGVDNDSASFNNCLISFCNWSCSELFDLIFPADLTRKCSIS